MKKFFFGKKDQTGIRAMNNEDYMLAIENEKALQKTEYAWWSHPVFIVFLTVAMSVLDALVLYDIMDKAMLQSEYMGKIVSFGIALILNMLPLLIAKFAHQAIYKIKRRALAWTLISIAAFGLLFAATVGLRFSYQDVYGEGTTFHISNEMDTEDYAEMAAEEEKETDPKALAIVMLLSVEPLATSIVNFCLAFITDDELRSKINHLRRRRYELIEEESDLEAYIATTEPADVRRQMLLMLDDERLKACREEIHARCGLLKAQARTILAEYLKDPEGASYVTSEV